MSVSSKGIRKNDDESPRPFYKYISAHPTARARNKSTFFFHSCQLAAGTPGLPGSDDDVNDELLNCMWPSESGGKKKWPSNPAREPLGGTSMLCSMTHDCMMIRVVDAFIN